MAILLNAASSLRLRLDLVARTSDGERTPAELVAETALERYEHARPGGREEHGFAPLVTVRAGLLDLQLIAFLEELEALVAAGEGGAALESPGLALRLQGGPDGVAVEAGLDLAPALEKVAFAEPQPGSDLLLVRFAATKRNALAFCASLVEEFAGWPTDPAKVRPGQPG